MRLVKALSLLLYVEGGSLVLLGLGYGGYSLSRTGDHAPAVLAAAAALGVGVVLLLLARGVAKGKGWARTPAVLLNVFPFPLALSAFRGGAWWVGVTLLLLAGGVLYLFATPELRETFRES